MKKFLSLALVLAMMVSTAALTACGEDSKGTSGGSSSSDAPSSSNTPANTSTPAQSDDQTAPASNPPISNPPISSGNEETAYHAFEEVDNIDAWKQDKTNLTEAYFDQMVASHSIFSGFDYTESEEIEEAGTHELASNLFDGDPTTKWCSLNSAAEFCSAIVWVMESNVNVVGYTITTANDNASYTNRNPISWRLYGAAELPEPRMDEEVDGLSYFDTETVPSGWTLIDAVDAGMEDDPSSSLLPDMNYTEVGMNVANPGTYKYFMLLLDYCEGDRFQIGDFTLYGSVA